MNDSALRASRQRMTDQERGRLAWNNIVEVAGKSDAVKKKYRTQTRQLAALVRANGLAQTLAFLYAKARIKDKQRSEDAQAAELMLSHVNQALRPLFGLADGTLVSWLLDTLLRQPSHVHRQATVEALAFARWLSRFAEAELPSEELNQ
jgi:CRISPR-associated protein Cmr5